jgi:hypothetical protein
MTTRLNFHFVSLDTMGIPPFDTSRLPFEVLESVEVADVSALLPPSLFAHMRGEVGRHRMYYLESTGKFALKHQYEVETPFAVTPITPESSEVSSDSLMNLVYACLKLIRPTREQSGVRAEVGMNGTIGIRSVSFADGRLDLPEGEKLYAIRNKDLELLRNVIQPFLKTMQGEYWPFRMAVEYYDRGYAVNDGKARYLYWGSSALHALYSSNNDKITQRVKGFLGADTLVYDPADRPEFEFLQPSSLTIGDLIEDMNEVRNCVAHGRRIANKFFTAKRKGLNGDVTSIQVLEDALGFVIRESLLQILKSNLMEHFKSEQTVSTYWKGRGL